MFFSDRMGDQGRADYISDMKWHTDPVDLATEATKTFWKAYPRSTELRRG